jgi:hypothetical protein
MELFDLMATVWSFGGRASYRAGKFSEELEEK